jgi:hypothetical protein
MRYSGLHLLAVAAATALAPIAAAAQQPMTQQQLFDAKVRCGTYLDKLNADLERDQYAIEFIPKVFFSQSLNTCLVEKVSISSAHGTVPQEELLTIDDVLTSENVWTSELISPAIAGYEAEARLDLQAQQYQ